ncbi:MAG: RnfABCDGE type electron transport complex subunit D [Flavobacteriales bacterium]|nr:RnfABCDGE type electron transport complex subunit D [Flavobacteriales bacterium]
MTQTIASNISRNKLFKDARDFQIIWLSIFLLYGVWFLQWDNYAAYAVLIGTSIITQLFGGYLLNIPKSSLKSAVITALSLCLIFSANSLFTYGLCAVLAISSKFLLRLNGKHIFNPSLFGIVFCVLFTGDAWVSPGKWGNEYLLVVFFIACALLVLLKVGRIDTSLAFLLTLMAFEFIRTYIYFGDNIWVYLQKFSSGTILLFAFFMITDPMTTPKSLKGRIIWGVMIGALTFYLSNFMQSYTAPIWALTIATPFTIILNSIFKGAQFQWIPTHMNLQTQTKK